MIPCRLILSEPADGAMNMALDEALLESAAGGTLRTSRETCATLRVYQWARPTLSLGYFQHAADRQLHESSRQCDLVRRPSGGGAILHDRELTYALVLPAAIASGEVASGWYDLVHNVLVAAIKEMTKAQAELCEARPKRSPAGEPFLCFQRRAAGDVLFGDHKIAGSAQRRRRGAILQHGSVLLGRSPCAPELPGICDLTDIEIEYDQFASLFCRLLEEALPFEFEASGLNEQERAAAEDLLANKYAALAWTLRR